MPAPQQTVVKLYVSNIPYAWSESELEALFSSVGRVTERRVIRDHETLQSRGFGFVALDTHPHPVDHWRQLQGIQVPDGTREPRTLTIDIAKPKMSSAA